MNKKKSLNISDKQVLVGQFLASGKTMNKWCQDKGISTSTFHAWIKKYADSKYTNVDFVEVSKTTRGIAKTINEDAPLQNVEDLQSTTNYFKHNPKSQNIIITYKDFNINISNDTDLVRLSNVLKVVTGIDV